MSDMVRDLASQEIKLNNLNVGAHKTICPRCSHTRKNKKDPCLWVNIKDGSLAMWKCHNCLWTGAAGNVSKDSKEASAPREFKKPDVKADAAVLPALAMQFLLDRKLTEPVITRNKLFWDDKRKAICFPYYVGGELLNVKYRTLDKRFMMTKDAKLTFYGLDDLRDAWRESEDVADEIIIVEGELDKLALEVCGIRNVISVPNGAPARIKEGEEIDNSGAFAYLAHAEALFKQSRRVILAVDDDAAGDNLRYELSRRIGAAKCFVVKFPHKDANGCLLHMGVDEVLNALQDKQPYPIAGLHSVDGMYDDLVRYYSEGMRAGCSTGFENLDKLFTAMQGEVTVVTGIPNSGKSELMDALMINLAKFENWPFAVFSPEGVKEQHIAMLIEKVVGAPSAPNAPNRMTLEEFMNGAAWVAKYFHFIRADDEAQLPTLDYVLEKASAAVYRHGIKGFLLDPWNELEHSRPSNITDTEYVGQSLAKICRWAKNRQVKVFIVAHPTKISTDKDGKMRVPGLYDILGSSNWANKMDNGIVVHRSIDISDTTELHIRKVRSKFVGRTGMCTLKYDRSTGQYSVPPNHERFEGVHSNDSDMKTFEVG